MDCISLDKADHQGLLVLDLDYVGIPLFKASGRTYFDFSDLADASLPLT